ncbi:unnamed protein product [Brachionus calyciflorus]|uniref:Uncharacterized protein n=1 Tax=Brachionus calyciflorus TaxID=104777 RepID=A0A814LEF6_9BILA|nr:unnamed protein product [Brachionus calyciflorus]
MDNEILDFLELEPKMNLNKQTPTNKRIIFPVDSQKFLSVVSLSLLYSYPSFQFIRDAFNVKNMPNDNESYVNSENYKNYKESRLKRANLKKINQELKLIPENQITYFRKCVVFVEKLDLKKILSMKVSNKTTGFIKNHIAKILKKKYKKVNKCIKEK